MNGSDALRKIKKREIESQMTPRGGYTRQTLEKWGVVWPPPKGWKEKLIYEAGNVSGHKC